MFTVILYILAAVLLLISFVKDRGKTKAALKKAWKAFENIMPQFLSILVIIGIVLSVLNAQTISALIGNQSGWLGTVVLGLLGSVTLIPGFIAFPLAASLLGSGAGYAQLAAFISTLMMVGVVTLPVEMKYFGRKASVIRNSLAFVFSYGIAALMGVILR